MKHPVVSSVFLFLFFSFVLSAKIDSLPGYNGPELSMYSGYININQQYGSNMFYWLIEAEEKAQDKPLVVWFQGGPGCSGLIGLMTENGPLRPNLAGDGLDYTNLGWTQFANMLYIEAPVGVGFSYATDPEAYNTNDNITAENNFLFLEAWLKEFPEYEGRSTWFAGESYAGIYIPTLTSLVLNNQDSQLYSQLQGFMDGNPVFRCESANYTAIQFNLFYWHGLVSYSHYLNWTQHSCDSQDKSAVCLSIFAQAYKELGLVYQQTPSHLPSLDPDDLYQDFCTGNGTLEFAASLPSASIGQSTGSRVNTYLNRADVQQAIHAKSAQWSSCTSKLNYKQLDYSMVPLYQSFFSNTDKLDILVYSGDIDIATVPFAQTQACLNELVVKGQEVWQPWFVNGATAGYFEKYEEYTYATIKGAGHEAPAYQPLTSFQMAQRWLKDRNLKETSSLPSKIKKATTQGDRLRALNLAV